MGRPRLSGHVAVVHGIQIDDTAFGLAGKVVQLELKLLLAPWMASTFNFG